MTILSIHLVSESTPTFFSCNLDKDYPVVIIFCRSTTFVFYYITKLVLCRPAIHSVSRFSSAIIIFEPASVNLSSYSSVMKKESQMSTLWMFYNSGYLLARNTWTVYCIYSAKKWALSVYFSQCELSWISDILCLLGTLWTLKVQNCYLWMCY